MANHPNRNTRRTQEISGYRMEVSRHVPRNIWWLTVTRLADGVRFGEYELGGKSYSDPAEAMSAGGRWIAREIKAQAEFARLTRSAA